MAACFFVLAAPLLNAAGNAGGLTIDDSLKREKIGGYFQYYIDTGGISTPGDITSGKYDSLFKPVDKDHISFRHSRDTFWLRLEIHNPMGKAVSWHLSLLGTVDHAVLYYPAAYPEQGAYGTYMHMETGTDIPYDSRPVDSFFFTFPVTTLPGTHTLYIRLKSDTPIAFMPIAIEPGLFKKLDEIALVIAVFLFGIMFALGMYNAFIYYSVREKSYLYLVLLIACYLLAGFHESNLFEKYTGLNFQWLIPFIMYSALFALLYFTRSFLNTKIHMPKLDKAMVLAAGFLIPAAVISFIAGRYRTYQLVLLLAIAALLLTLACGILSLIRKVRGASYYMLSTSLFLVTLLLNFLDFFGSGSTSSRHFFASFAGFILMVFLLSMGIGNKLSTMRKEQEKALEALEESEKKFRTIFENASEGIYQFTPDMELITINPALARIFGFGSVDEFRCLSCFKDQFDPETPQKIKQAIQQTGYAANLETRAYRQDGRPIDVSISAHAVKDDKGNVLYVEGFLTDITEIKNTEKLLRLAKEELEQRVEERTAELSQINYNLKSEIAEREKFESALKKSEERYRNLIDTMNEGFAIIDEHGKLTYVNPKLRDMFGYADEDEVLGRSIFDFLDDENAEILKEQMAMRRTGKVTPYEIEWLKKDGGTLTTIVSPQAIFDDDGNYKGSSSVLTDITALKEAEAEMKKARDEAENANRAKSEFLANMSHEIRTPMNAVLGFTDLLYSQVTDSKQRSYLESIKSSGKSLLMLINDILDLSKIEAGRLDLQYEAVNPYTIFNEIKQIFSMKIENKGLEFIIEIAPHIPGSLLLEEVRLRQVLFNLIGNAVKFTEEGYIKLYVKKIDTSQDKSTLDLVVGVEDTGIGIPAESQQKIFDAFKQQDGQSAKKYGGTGLGLAITKRLVEMMGGELSLKSEVNNGSTFEFTLHNVTVAAAGPAAEAARTFDQELISFEPTLILVVDDIETNRLLIREFLTNRDFTVIEAVNGKEAVELAKEYKPAMVLMDIKMPVMDGYEAAAEMKKDKDLAAIPVIALTASAMKGDREKVLDKGFDGFLHKPVQVSDLFRELARFIGTTVTGTDTGTAVGPGKGKKKRKKKETGKRVSGEPVKIPNEAVKRLPAVLETLETESTDLWKTARKSGFFNEVMDFGKHIRSLGEENQLPLLTEFGDELINHANNFDIEKMNASLGAFPRMIEEIKHFSDKRVPA